jgi:hypothetical protein
VPLHIPGGSFAGPVSYVLAVARTASIESPINYAARRSIAGIISSPYAALTVDLNGLLPELESFTLATTDPARPALSFSSSGSLSSVVHGRALLVWQDAMDRRHTWTLLFPAASTSVQAPALPASLSDWTLGSAGAGLFLLELDTRRPQVGSATRTPTTPGRNTSLAACFFGCP